MDEFDFITEKLDAMDDVTAALYSLSILEKLMAYSLCTFLGMKEPDDFLWRLKASDKVNWCKRLGVLHEAECDDLSRIIKIRNEFAHHHGEPHMKNPMVLGVVDSLSIWNTEKGRHERQETNPDRLGMFKEAVTQLWASMGWRIADLAWYRKRHPKPVDDNEFWPEEKKRSE